MSSAILKVELAGVEPGVRGAGDAQQGVGVRLVVDAQPTDGVD